MLMLILGLIRRNSVLRSLLFLLRKIRDLVFPFHKNLMLE